MKKVLMAGKLPEEVRDYRKCQGIYVEVEKAYNLKLVAYAGNGLWWDDWWDEKICSNFASIANVPPQIMVDVSGIVCFSAYEEDAAVITIARHYKIPLVLIKNPIDNPGCRTASDCIKTAYNCNRIMLHQMEKEVPVFCCNNPENAISALKFIMQDGLQPGAYNEDNLPSY